MKLITRIGLKNRTVTFESNRKTRMKSARTVPPIYTKQKTMKLQQSCYIADKYNVVLER